MTTPNADLTRLIADLYAAERSVRALHAQIAVARDTDLLAALTLATEEALKVTDEDESSVRLVRLAELLGEMEGPKAADLLIDILGTDSLEARRSAGEALEDLAFDRFKELALAVERALERLPHGHAALTELPFLLSEVPEPGVRRLLARFLAHKDPEAVAATIEAIVDHADVAASDLLAPLEKDTRQVEMEDEEGDEGRVTIGELATEARSLLAELGVAEGMHVEPKAPPAPAKASSNPAAKPGAKSAKDGHAPRGARR
jgi:HEAT repeat protein